jgi:hypothetical protein
MDAGSFVRLSMVIDHDRFLLGYFLFSAGIMDAISDALSGGVFFLQLEGWSRLDVFDTLCITSGQGLFASRPFIRYWECTDFDFVQMGS